MDRMRFVSLACAPGLALTGKRERARPVMKPSDVHSKHVGHVMDFICSDRDLGQYYVASLAFFLELCDWVR